MTWLPSEPRTAVKSASMRVNDSIWSITSPCRLHNALPNYVVSWPIVVIRFPKENFAFLKDIIHSPKGISVLSKKRYDSWEGFEVATRRCADVRTGTHTLRWSRTISWGMPSLQIQLYSEFRLQEFIELFLLGTVYSMCEYICAREKYFIVQVAQFQVWVHRKMGHVHMGQLQL